MSNEIQLRILDVFKAVSQLCDEEGLRYFAIGGTAIGAARHQGFIPWDDDLDIAMPIEDYTRFLEIARERLKPLQVLSPGDLNGYTCIFSKVIDGATTLIEEECAKMPERYTGVWVDVMPMSGVPTRGLRQRFFVGAVRALRAVNDKVRLPKSWRPTLKHRLFSGIGSMIRGVFGINCASNLWSGLLESHPFDEASLVGYTWSENLGRLIFPKEWFDGYVEMPFEDTIIRMPVGYDEYLTKQFGDYMTVPPESERVTHGCFFDGKHSYREYQRGSLQIPTGYFGGGEL